MNETLQIVLQILTAITGILVIVKQFITDKKITVVDTKVTVVDTKVKEAVDKVVNVDNKINDVSAKVDGVTSKVDGVNDVQKEVKNELNGRLGELIDLTQKAYQAKGDLAAREQIKQDEAAEDSKPEYMIKKLLDEFKTDMLAKFKPAPNPPEDDAKVIITKNLDK